ncbi:MAG TPA: DUF2905 domain-containing protein [Hyphomicrobiaceae bacterium]|nr:DUF2905 domain-containing protein [Hyphomicrobiaceae bacterium]
MRLFLLIFIGVMLALALVGFMADKRAEAGDPDCTPGLTLLPGDIKYESGDGRVRIYFPIVTSIVASIVLTILLRLLG